MHNPFLEAVDESTDLELIALAVGGDRAALERLVLRHQAWIYNIALRMVFHPQDAEEVTQEVLIKALTRLSTFRHESRFRTWLYRIAANHVLNMRRREGETTMLNFSGYADAINEIPDLELPDPRIVPVDVPLLVEEAKLSCSLGMLLCLDRQQRLVFILGEIFGVVDTVGGELLDLSADHFRQLLSRARRDLYRFLHGQCGLVDARNPCRCPKKTAGFVRAGHVDPERLQFAADHRQRVADAAPEVVRTLESASDRHAAALFREHPFFEPHEPLALLRRLLDDDGFARSLRLD
ncbi:MAG TPA: RNA polymerase subunit sigma-70 [Planctomycetaceae bacterium]|nr:RNA polymerase subunit sigma-70 [Planctomycetaceae bacterium]HRF00198.1 RNA polymerase sigma factor [Pirellulaceae bacterium]